MARYLLNFDLFNQKIDLCFQASKAHKTYIGALLSLGVYIFVGIVFLYQLIDLSNQSHPIVSQSEVITESPGVSHSCNQPYYFRKNDFLVAFSVMDDQLQSLSNDENHNYFTASLTINGNQSIQYVKCDNQEFVNFKDTSDLSDGYCVNMTQLNMYNDLIMFNGSLEGVDSSIAIFAFQFCQSDITENCTRIGNMSGYIKFKQSEYLVNQKSAYPYQKYIAESIVKLDSFTFYRENRLLKGISFINNLNPFYFGGKQETYQAYQSTTKSPQNIPFIKTQLMISYGLDYVEQSFERSYPTFLDVIAQVGGLLGMFRILFLTILKPFVSADLNTKLAAQFFDPSSQEYKKVEILFGGKDSVYNQTVVKLQKKISVDKMLKTIQRQRLLERILFSPQQMGVFKSLELPRWQVQKVKAKSQTNNQEFLNYISDNPIDKRLIDIYNSQNPSRNFDRGSERLSIIDPFTSESPLPYATSKHGNGSRIRVQAIENDVDLS